MRLLRDNTYRVEIEKPGYKIASTQIVSEYDWLWGTVTCGPCEAVGALPSYDVSDQNIAVRFAESAFYEYPKGFIGGWGKGLRLFSPDALLGSTFKTVQGVAVGTGTHAFTSQMKLTSQTPASPGANSASISLAGAIDDFDSVPNCDVKFTASGVSIPSQFNQ